CQQYEALPLTF
nr:immunoglobulin light chain junction region [Macaca mulatta]MOV74562.1 immunoglobulin light chain junction region [Macaca mulatta]MOV74806.1 immunoglobulin light chain junction region [Macaca mulatta]MOV74838.1 immunoglobulin light chain junction region [Macaca mulatta]MOV74904.1 immunoglobulin light chain junction region [Macaca mulatta]